MRRRTKNRMGGLMGICLLGLGALLVLFVLSSFVDSQPSAAQGKKVDVVITSVPPAAAPATLGLWDGYGRAFGAAQAEAPDVQLVSASAQWRVSQEEALLAGSDTWAFTFYSEASERVFDLVVTTGGAWVVNQSEAGLAPALLTYGKWHEGPRDALLIFLAHGGRDFLAAHPQATVELRLNQHGDGYPLWNVMAVDFQSRESFMVTVNAASMAMVTVTR